MGFAAPAAAFLAPLVRLMASCFLSSIQSARTSVIAALLVVASTDRPPPADETVAEAATVTLRHAKLVGSI